MKTTVEVPDQLYRRVKAQAAMRGQTVKAFLLDALRAKLGEDDAKSAGKTGWRAAFGTARAADVAAVQRVVDREFSRIDAEGWK
jgi:predicted transcriptional regulator